MGGNLNAQDTQDGVSQGVAGGNITLGHVEDLPAEIGPTAGQQGEGETAAAAQRTAHQASLLIVGKKLASGAGGAVCTIKKERRRQSALGHPSTARGGDDGGISVGVVTPGTALETSKATWLWQPSLAEGAEGGRGMHHQPRCRAGGGGQQVNVHRVQEPNMNQPRCGAGGETGSTKSRGLPHANHRGIAGVGGAFRLGRKAVGGDSTG